MSVITYSGSTYTVWQFVVFLVHLYSYHDDGRESDRNTSVINNM